jgi:hypothetical protein
MKAVMPVVPEHILQWRKTTGTHCWDEMWIVDRDPKVPQVYRLTDGDYQQQTADADGELKSAVTGVRLHAARNGALGIRLGEDASTERLLPD